MGPAPTSTHDGPLTFVPASGSLLSVAGRYYRGSASVFRDRTGLTVVNRVALEDYLAGVVSAEMGKREPGDREALAAQAVISTDLRAQECGEAAFGRVRPVSDGGGSGLRRSLGRDPARMGGGAGDVGPGSHLQRHPDRCLLLFDLWWADCRGHRGIRGSQPTLSPVRTGPGRERTGLLPLSPPAFAGAKSGPAISSRPSCGESVPPRFGKCGRSRSWREPARTGWHGSPSGSMMTRWRSRVRRCGRSSTR